MGAAGHPLAVGEVDRVLAPFARYDAVLIGVSGGPDSLALMHFAAEWNARRGRAAPRLCVATVDHGLREESASEAAFVARCARALGLEHRILRWEERKPASGIADAARNARYNLLECAAIDFAGTAKVALAVAHTSDDQAETFLMRLQRGAGIDGLSAMAPTRAVSPGSEVTLLRPLLDIAKSRLVASLQARGVDWIEDPTNEDTQYERPRLRRLLQTLASESLHAPALARSAQRLRKAQDVIVEADRQFVLKVGLRIDREIFAELDSQAFRSGPPLLRERLLMRLIRRFAGATPAPDLSEAEDLVRRLEDSSQARMTLGGAVVSQGPRCLRVWRELGRMSHEPLALAHPDVGQLWDSRFWVAADGIAAGTIHVRPLGLDGLAALEHILGDGAAPSRALATLPAFYFGDRLIGVPALSYQEPGYPRVRAQAAHAG